VLRLARRRLARRDFPVVVGRGALIEPQFEDWIVRYGFEGKHRRDPAFRFAFSLLRPGDTAFDVGANIGLWSLIAARRVGAAGRIWAFEAIPSTAGRLERNRALSGSPPQLVIENLAASDSNGTITIHETGPANSAGATLRPIEGGRPLTVRSTSLDTYWRGLGEPNLRLLKVDTEGAEYKVLTGAIELLGATNPVVIFECDEQFLSEAGATATDVFQLLADCGYRIHELRRGSLVPAAPSGEHRDLVAVKVAP
jgi:FkbM family methyltransferase